MVFGVPTVRRQQQTYLIQTLINIVSNMNQTEQKDSLIVVMIGEVMSFFNCQTKQIYYCEYIVYNFNRSIKNTHKWLPKKLKIGNICIYIYVY